MSARIIAALRRKLAAHGASMFACRYYVTVQFPDLETAAKAILGEQIELELEEKMESAELAAE
jgi:hypothetical protein